MFRRQFSCLYNKSFRSSISSIENRTEYTKERSLTPEIGLHLLTPSLQAYHAPANDITDEIFKNDPFWAIYWPGGLLQKAWRVMNKAFSWV